jgi:glycerate-2-kinase
MNEGLIKNFDELAIDENRKLILQVVEAGLMAINTRNVVLNSISLQDNFLKIQNQTFNLNEFKNVKIIGIGKSSGEATLALEEILNSKITEGAIVGLDKISCKYVETFVGTHPRPSEANLEAGKKIYELLSNSKENDLIIVIVSGGGSALLNYPESEYIQGEKLYDAFLESGQSRIELNTVWKHLSLFKGGGLAKIAYPATIIGLIFSDIPGNNFENVASGPTYKDFSTITDAQKIITDNNLGDFTLLETPKEDKYFEKVHNFVLVSNEVAVQAMAEKAQELGLSTDIVSTELFDNTTEVLKKIFSTRNKNSNNSIVLAAGEPRIEIKDKNGKGGRNLHLGLQALKNIDENSVFISLASDGMDNSDVAGAIIDQHTREKTTELGLDINDYLNRFDSYSFFQKTGDTIITGPTGSNVSDLMLLLTK